MEPTPDDAGDPCEVEPVLVAVLDECAVRTQSGASAGCDYHPARRFVSGGGLRTGGVQVPTQLSALSLEDRGIPFIDEALRLLDQHDIGGTAGKH